MPKSETADHISFRNSSSVETSTAFIRQLQESNEKLRAANRELQRVNERLGRRIRQLEGGECDRPERSDRFQVKEPELPFVARKDRAGVLLVGEDHEIVRFTSAAGDFLNLQSSDIGRPLSQVTDKLPDETLLDDIDRVTNGSASIEKEIGTGTNTSYILRIGPYRTDEDTVRGAIVTVMGVKRTEEFGEYLREREELQRLAFEGTKLGIWICDLDSGHMYCDRRAREILGIRSGETVAMDRGLHLICPPGSRSTESGLYAFLEESSTGSYTVERRVLNSEGIVRWVAVRGRVRRADDAESRVSRVMGVVEDITDQKRRDEEIGRSERRYRRLFEEAQEGILIVAPDGKIVDINRAGIDMLGYTFRELQRIDTARLYANIRRFRELWRLLERDGAVEEEELRLRRKNGEEIICRVSATPRCSLSGDVEAYQIFFRDKTDEHRARQGLRESERKFRQLAEQSLLGLALVQDNSFKYVNPKAAELFGRPQEVIVDYSHPADLVHPGDRPEMIEFLEKRHTGDCEEHMAVRQMRLQSGDGEIIPVEAYCNPITSEGEPALLCYLLDITERRRLERELLQVQEEERRRLGQELHDSVASQLVGVTMILSSHIQNMKAGSIPSPEELERVNEMIREGGEQLRELSHGLHPGQLKGEALPQALEDLADSMDFQFGGACQFENRCELPHLNEAMATHLYRIAQEAVTNAAKYAGAETVRIVLERDGEALVLRIRDDGEGFDPGAQTSGIGLRSMRYRARLIGAQFDLSSSEERGTTVNCRLPGRYERDT